MVEILEYTIRWISALPLLSQFPVATIFLVSCIFNILYSLKVAFTNICSLRYFVLDRLIASNCLVASYLFKRSHQMKFNTHHMLQA